MMSAVKNTRDHLIFRIAEIQKDIQDMSIDNGPALLVEFARIEENRNALMVLNGGVSNVNKEEKP